MDWDGVINLNKPAFISSAAALNTLKRTLPRKTKLGHAGTLDPLATGVLVCLVGRATKLSDSVMQLAKSYRGTIRLGATSETDDSEGPVHPRLGVEIVGLADIEKILPEFIGNVSQMPPAYSAIKLNGKRACDRVRDGQNVFLNPRNVRIDAIRVIRLDWPDLEIDVDCGKGTYIRSLARDVGERLGTGGFLSSLVRTGVGPFTIEKSIELAAVGTAAPDSIFVPFDLALSQIARFSMENSQTTQR